MVTTIKNLKSEDPDLAGDKGDVKALLDELRAQLEERSRELPITKTIQEQKDTLTALKEMVKAPPKNK